MLTRRFAVHLNRSLVELLAIVIEKTDVSYLRSFLCVVVKKTFQVTCGDPETEVDLILSRAGIFDTPKDIDGFTICPTHRSNLSTGVGWIRGSISRCRVPKEVYGHGKGRVESIPKAYWRFGKHVLQIVRKTSGKFIQPGYLPPCTKLRVPSDLGLDWELVNRLPKVQIEVEFFALMYKHFVGFRRLAGREIKHTVVKGPSVVATRR